MDLERGRASRIRELKPKFVLAETARLEPSLAKCANQNFSVGLEDVFCSTISTTEVFSVALECLSYLPSGVTVTLRAT